MSKTGCCLLRAACILVSWPAIFAGVGLIEGRHPLITEIEIGVIVGAVGITLSDALNAWLGAPGEAGRG